MARNQSWQQRVYDEVSGIDEFTPDQLLGAKNLTAVLDETLRLTPSLYFLPRRATQRTRVETADGRIKDIPAKTHVLLDVWHANRHLISCTSDLVKVHAFVLASTSGNWKSR